MLPRMAPIHTSVMAALRDSGRRKAGTPLEIASTPDSATAPDEKARIKMNSVMPVMVAPLSVMVLSAACWLGMTPRLPK